MKICLISFDNWGYDEKIANELIKMGHETSHIKLLDFKYKYNNLGERILNFFNKTLLKKNIKKIKTEEYILATLKNKGTQDKIIVINPERISNDCHLEIKKFSASYIAFLYDSLDRYNNKALINNNIFNKTFTFDKKDAQNHNLLFLSNYIHLEKSLLKKNIKYKVLSISSIDERYPVINSIVDYLDERKIKHKTIFLGKRKPKKLRKSVEFTKTKMTQSEIQKKIEHSEIILDILRENQTGLSFRIFDALALDKKIITTNESIKEYDFYNPNNILVIEPDNISIPDSFLNSAYEIVPEEIYQKYTLNNWINILLKDD
ncbi:hypothetical protein [Flavobacterium hydrophilum]|uniref:Glycosyltransferase n=1 Tax=Flavobacterium hydrophilum TaxID=2211445 RepID=A0A2V4BXG3_9FLAO|nr:hypothetical protein [Flavobacterium hydrophilum]PXY43699.1 hypothetical protein DMB68_19135 [Flavobacterium hydrophilum]